MGSNMMRQAVPLLKVSHPMLAQEWNLLLLETQE